MIGRWPSSRKIAGLLTNRAVALRRLDRPREALMSASRALVGNPNFAQARFVESVARLTLGDFAAGWRGYEARWSVGLLASQRRGFTAPLWSGKEALNGKTILLHAEQGFGDTIQFVRYAALVAERGAAKVIIEVQRELVPLLAGMAGATAVTGARRTAAGFRLALSVAQSAARLRNRARHDPGADSRISRRRQTSIAAWRRSAAAAAAAHRRGMVRRPRSTTTISIGRSGWKRWRRCLICRTSASSVCSTTSASSDLPVLAKLPNLHAFRTAISRFCRYRGRDLAARCRHIGGHGGRACGGRHRQAALLLLPFAADFRWLRERQDSPWYPTARLYRQPKFGDWESVIDAVATRFAAHGIFSATRKLSA